jgi:plasmid stability protein
LVVRNLDDELVRRLKERARGEGRSAEAEHRRILEEALRPKMTGRELWESLSRGGPVEVDFGGGTDDTPRRVTFD